MPVPYTADAAPMAVELFQKQQKRLVEMRDMDAPEWKCTIWNRYCETALRYALIRRRSPGGRLWQTVGVVLFGLFLFVPLLVFGTAKR